MISRKGRLLILLLTAALLLPGCAKKTDDGTGGSGYRVYFPYTESEQSRGRIVGSELHALTGDEELLHAALTALMKSPDSSQFVAVLPPDVTILSYSVSGGEITLNMSTGYGELSGFDLTVVQSCIVLTLCGLKEISSVSIYIEDKPSALALREDMILLENLETNPYEKQIRMYFANESGRYLTPELHLLTIGQDKELALYVMEELLHGPKSAELHSVIPEGTSIRSLTVENGICRLDLSGEFLYNRPESIIEERLTLYSIVNSLTSLTGIDSVQFLIEGKRMEWYHYFPIYNPITRGDKVIESADEPSGLTDLTLYMADKTLSKLLALPIQVRRDDYVPMEYTVVKELLSQSELYGYTRLFGKNITLVSTETKDNICTVTLSREFLDCQNIDLAAQSICAALTELPGIEAVLIRLGNVQYPGSPVLDRVLYPDESLIIR